MNSHIKQFTDNQSVRAEISELRRLVEGKSFSDVLDDDGNQYVDLVLQGGGMLGIALVGYTYALERAGLRFRSIAGTSAGAINAILVASLGAPCETKSERMLGYLADLKIDQFLDGNQSSVALSRALVDGVGKVRFAWLGYWAYQCALKDKHGLHPGDRFLGWIRDILRASGISSYRDLHRRMGVVPHGLQPRPGRDLEEHRYGPRMEKLFPGRLAIVAVDVATKTKFVFPKMSLLVFDKPEEVDPAWFVRASMSIPGFFEPVRVERLGERDPNPPHHVRLSPELQGAWRKHAGLERLDPDFTHHVFVDGGVISNFPIAEFHANDRVPLMPTFGAKLGPTRNGEPLDSFGAFGHATFNAARQSLDFDFLHRNPDYKQLIAIIDTSDHHWLDFELTTEGKVDLFQRGVRAAKHFLQDFDWTRYKETRAELAKAECGITPEADSDDRDHVHI